MMRRWLSVRGRKDESKDDILIKKTQNDFDYAFMKPQALVECQDIQDTEVLRPTTSGGERYRPKRKPDLTLLIERPRSSDSTYSKTPLSARLDGSRIDLAFGSPRHPPQEFVSIASTMSPQLRQPASVQDETSSAPATKNKKWRFGLFFKSRPEPPGEAFYQAQAHSPDSNKLGLPIQRTPWRNPKSPPVPQNGFTDQPHPTNQDRPHVTFVGPHWLIQCESGAGKDTVPCVSVSIPVTPLDRYSVMFKDVNGLKQSELLKRRSRELDHLSLTNTTPTREESLHAPQLQRRATSPSMATHQEGQTNISDILNSQKYSLFPSTPTSIRSLSRSDSPHTTRDRSATTSPLTEKPSTTKEPLHCASISQPEMGQCSIDFRPPVFPATTVDSRASSTSEIFFDIKSLRDSSGQVGQQFEMTRPPSVAVQLARSKSSARKQQQRGVNKKSDELDSHVSETTVDQSTAAQIDETIKLVESLRSPSTSPPVIPNQEKVQISQEAQRCLQALNRAGSEIKKARRKSSLKSRLEWLNIDVPSPVLEAAEEATPRVAAFLPRERYEPMQDSPPMLHHGKDRSSPKQSVPPPRVLTIKDAHNIPLSKYAPKSTTEELVRQTGLRPVRPVRANTDNAISFNPRTSSLVRPDGPSRSATLPTSIHLPRSKYSVTPPIVAGPTGRNIYDKETPVVIAYAKPAAEVSVARTVSLSRRPSTRVTVTRHQSRHEPKKDSEQVTEKKVSLGIPVIQEVQRKHKHGQSMDAVVETATIAPSSPPPPIPSSSIFGVATPPKNRFALLGV